MSNVYYERRIYILGFFGLMCVLLVVQALRLQVLDNQYKKRADATAIDKVTLYPSRGLIYDRNGKLLVNNNPVYDVMVTYDRVSSEMDVVKFCQLLGIDPATYPDRLERDWRSRRYHKAIPYVFLKNISAETYARFQESLYEFPGFYVQVRNVRGYPYPNAAHVLGYIREVNREEIQNSTGVYRLGDYIGASGLEYYYEQELRGNKGVRYVLKDNLGRDVGSYQNGAQDTIPVNGQDLISTLDIELQAYGERLMANKRGSIVAIEPQSGEVLAMLSTPTYDPNLLTINRNRGAAYQQLIENEDKPLFDRSVMAQYPPGSLFKTVVGLVGMQEEVTAPNRMITCQGAYYHQGQRLTGCHGHPTCFSMQQGIQHSCNAYFVTVFRDIVDKFGFYNPQEGLDHFNTYLGAFGMGSKLGIDLHQEARGNYPGANFYDKAFAEDGRWNSLWIRSLGIGQGELLTTNLQLAHIAAIIANRGTYRTPHLVRGFVNTERQQIRNEQFEQRRNVGIDSEYFGPVVDGMEQVVLSGTAQRAYIQDLPICGKTGTAENPHGRDHSIFFAFAPKEQPEIAIAVYVENGGFGGTYAAPIASLMIEKYLRRSIHPNRHLREQRILDTDLTDNLP